MPNARYARVPFTSSARADGLTLRHWRRATAATGADCPWPAAEACKRCDAGFHLRV